MMLEFMKDGKLAISVEGVTPAKADGTYKLDGDKLDITVKYPTGDKKETLTVKKLTDTEMETTDSKNVTDTFTKVKDKEKEKK